MLHAIIDTNILIRGLIGFGARRQIYLSFKAGKFNLFISPLMFEELIRTLNKPKLKPLIDPQESKDIECASEVKVNFIVSEDKDRLVLKSFRSIPIIKPGKFLSHLEK